jgi:hypothetical protein
LSFSFSYLGGGGLVRRRRGDEEDELAAGDGWREAGGVVEVGLEQQQPVGLRADGDEPLQQARFPLVPCSQPPTGSDSSTERAGRATE